MKRFEPMSSVFINDFFKELDRFKLEAQKGRERKTKNLNTTIMNVSDFFLLDEGDLYFVSFLSWNLILTFQCNLQRAIDHLWPV